MKTLSCVAAIALGLLSPLMAQQRPTAESALAARLALYGHRNWIVIADAAYPAQTSPGVETVHIGGDQISAMKQVLAALGKTHHVQPVVHIDAELQHLDDKLAPGVETFRKELTGLLEKQRSVKVPHEQIIAKLDDAGKTFRVLILKTDATIPYTSVFLQLDCGYWSPEKEAELRARMK